MNNQDTKILIISELSNNDLINAISIDKSTYRLFSQKLCWDIIFKKHNLPLSTIIYDDTSQWLVLFKKEIKLKIYTNRLMDILEHPKIEDFEAMDGIHGLYIHNELSIHHQDISFIHILNVEGINMKEINKICNKCAINRLDKMMVEDVGFTTCSMYTEGEKYVISIYNPSLYYDNIRHDFYRYYIERDNMKQIFYNILSHGVIPVDQYNGNPVKLITKT
jgi:DNA-binding Xre family transcriptional regulator